MVKRKQPSTGLLLKSDKEKCPLQMTPLIRSFIICIYLINNLLIFSTLLICTIFSSGVLVQIILGSATYELVFSSISSLLFSMFLVHDAQVKNYKKILYYCHKIIMYKFLLFTEIDVEITSRRLCLRYHQYIF